MGGKNEFLKKRDERDKKFFMAGMQMGCQMATDFVQMALRDPGTMGKDIFGRARIEKLFQRCKELDDYYHIAFSDHVEADQKQEEMDGVLREYFGNDLIPFAERYPYAQVFSYDKPRKGWVE